MYHRSYVHPEGSLKQADPNSEQFQKELQEATCGMSLEKLCKLYNPQVMQRIPVLTAAICHEVALFLNGVPRMASEDRVPTSSG